MKTRVIGIKETSASVFRLTFDGTVLGDSRGYSKDQAIQEAKNWVARHPNDGNWGPNGWSSRTSSTRSLKQSMTTRRV